MLLGSLALLGVLLYSVYPGDTSGMPYPMTKQAMIEHLKEIETALRDTEREYRELEVYTKMVVSNAPLSEEASIALGRYNEAIVKRHSAECRIKNLKKLIGKYEEITHDIDTRKHDSSGIGEGQETAKDMG